MLSCLEAKIKEKAINPEMNSEDYQKASLSALNRAGKQIIDNLVRTWQER